MNSPPLRIPRLAGTIAWLALVSCRDSPPPPGPKSESPWRNQKESFEAHLGVVETGWSKAKLVAHAGEPNDRSAGAWSYRWEESRVEGGFYSHFSFAFDGDTISAINESDGHVTKAPPLE